MTRRGFTLIELALVISLTAMIVGAVACIYIFAAERTAHALASSTVLTESSRVMDFVEKTVTNATTCSTVALGGGTALKCVMPANGVDFDGDGYYDSFTPSSVSRRCTERWGEGQRVWIYWSDATGNPSNTGTYLWRAKRVDDTTPTKSDADPNWTFYFGGSQGLSSMLTSFTFSVNSTAQTVTVSLQGSEETRAATTAVASDGAMAEYLSLSRTIYWRNWRQ